MILFSLFSVAWTFSSIHQLARRQSSSCLEDINIVVEFTKCSITYGALGCDFDATPCACAAITSFCFKQAGCTDEPLISQCETICAGTQGDPNVCSLPPVRPDPTMVMSHGGGVLCGEGFSRNATIAELLAGYACAEENHVDCLDRSKTQMPAGEFGSVRTELGCACEGRLLTCLLDQGCKTTQTPGQLEQCERECTPAQCDQDVIIRDHEPPVMNLCGNAGPSAEQLFTMSKCLLEHGGIDCNPQDCECLSISTFCLKAVGCFEALGDVCAFVCSDSPDKCTRTMVDKLPSNTVLSIDVKCGADNRNVTVGEMLRAYECLGRDHLHCLDDKLTLDADGRRTQLGCDCELDTLSCLVDIGCRPTEQNQDRINCANECGAERCDIDSLFTKLPMTTMMTQKATKTTQKATMMTQQATKTTQQATKTTQQATKTTQEATKTTQEATKTTNPSTETTFENATVATISEFQPPTTDAPLIVTVDSCSLKMFSAASLFFPLIFF